MDSQTTFIASVDEAANILGLSVPITKKILIENRLPGYIGFALPYDNDGKTSYRYIVFKQRLMAFLNADDFTV